MSIEAESVAVKEEVKIKEECDDELLDILPSTSKLIPEDDKEAIQASLKIDPEQDLKLLAGTSHGDSEYDCFEEKQFKMENVEPTEGTTSEDEDQSDSESEDLSDEGPPKIKSEELIIKSESAVDSDASNKAPGTGTKTTNKHVCPLCDFNAKYESWLTRHIWMKHKYVVDEYRMRMIPKYNKADSKYTCELCNFRTNFIGELRDHNMSEGHGDEYACDMCNYTTTQSLHLFQHKIRVHEKVPDKKHACKLCNYKTHKKSHLKNHFLAIHDQVTAKQYECEYCDYKSHFVVTLSKHRKRIHPEKASDAKLSATSSTKQK